jgi:hypothetical protein
MKFQIDLQIITNELEAPIKIDEDNAVYLSGEHEVWLIKQRIKDALDSVMGVGYILNSDISACNDEDSVEYDTVKTLM